MVFAAVGRMPTTERRSSLRNARKSDFESQKGHIMEDRRACVWMRGPRDADLKVSAAKWWLAITRDVMANEYRRMTAKDRPPVTCDRTPAFISPIFRQHSHQGD